MPDDDLAQVGDATDDEVAGDWTGADVETEEDDADAVSD